MKINEISQTDMICAENLIKSIAQGKFEFSGLEAMSFVKTCQWFNLVFSEMKKAYEVQQAATKGAVTDKATVKVNAPKGQKRAKKQPKPKKKGK